MRIMENNTQLKQVPDFILPGSDEKNHSLKDYLGKNVVLYFYPKDNTPGCTTEALDFKAHIDEFDKLNTVVLGISKDSVKSHCKFIDKHQLNFILLADEEKHVCSLYNVLKEKTMFGKKTIGIERSTFIINKDGYIVNEYRKVKVAGHVEEVLNYIKDNLI